MKIQIGKKYIDAYGNIVKIVRESEDIDYDFVDDKCIYFTKDGYYYYSDKRKSKYDLICEIDESILKEYKNKIISKYEFILQHYMKYVGSLKCLPAHQINTN